MLVLRNLTVNYGTKPALKGVSLSFPENRIVGIVGESGSGKTTLAHAVLGILPPYAKVKGSIQFNQKELVGAEEKDLQKMRGKEIAMVFQSAQNALHPCYRVIHQASEIVSLKLNISKREAEKNIIYQAKRFDLSEEALHRYPHQLSGGMKQRAYIALVLSLAPKLLIADEPTTALDVLVQAKVLKGLKEAQKEQKNLILLISHDFVSVVGFAQEIVIFYGGLVMEKGSRKQIRDTPQHPYTQHLLQSISMEKAPLETMPPSEKGCPFFPSCPKRLEKCAETPPSLEQKQGRGIACHAVS